MPSAFWTTCFLQRELKSDRCVPVILKQINIYYCDLASKFDFLSVFEPSEFQLCTYLLLEPFGLVPVGPFEGGGGTPRLSLTQSS